MQTEISANHEAAQGDLPEQDRQRLEQGKDRPVLVVEDDEDIAELLRYSLTRRGVEVVVAHDGMAGFDLAEEKRPGVILLDIMLPNLNGHEVCRLIRAHPDRGLARTPIIMLSALAGHGDIAKGMALGANGYFTKPYEIKEVVRAVRDCLALGPEFFAHEGGGFW
ncbi:response regulator transcription factor [Thiovibrio sp. JS02]